MAYVLFLWGLVYLFSLVRLHTNAPTNLNSIFRIDILLTGNIYISFMFFFPMQVLIPGWLNLKRLFLLYVPILILSTLYYAGMYCLNETPEILTSYSQLLGSFWHFNVWYRFILLLLNFTYIFLVTKWLYGYEKKYIKWKNDNYSDQDYNDVSWMRAYNLIILLISVFYLIVLLYGGRISVLMHAVAVIYSSVYLFYKALFYESPYPQNFFANGVSSASHNEIDSFADNLANEKESDPNEMSFNSKIPHYTETVKIWMEKEKPYLYKDFKLTDVRRVLPLNRSYLSRVFNDGFGSNFSEVIRLYRIEYAKGILIKNTNLPLYEIAEMSGFSSDSTFIRAFKQVTGTTPTQFKQDQASLKQ